ncbi:MAG TPA: hypothetical protein VGJ86_23900, partial [Acidimicrobiales bacterium]|jgi:hypothetical protein
MLRLPTEVLERQHGLITAEQLATAGITNAEIEWCQDSDRLAKLSPQVLRLLGAPPSEAQRVLAAVLDAGPDAALSHSAALAWWGIPGFTLDELHVTRARGPGRCRSHLATHVHELARFPPHHVRVLDGIPVTVPARALFDFAGTQARWPARMERAVDNAWSMHLVSGATLRRMLRELGRGRPGNTVMRDILRERGPDYVPPASGLEARVIEVLKKDGQPAMRRQVDTGDEEGWIGRIDFADVRLPLRLEVQSERFHSSLLDQQADADRIRRLEAAGFVVVTVTDLDVWQRPRHVADAVRAARRTLQRREESGVAGPREVMVGATP